MHNLTDWVTHMNWADYVFLVVLVYSAITGAWLGFLAECLTVAGVVAGTILAGLAYSRVGTWLGHVGVKESARDWAGFVALFVVMVLVFQILAVLARNISRYMIVGWSNIVAGCLLGVLAGGGICLFAIVAVTYPDLGFTNFRGTVEQSKIAASSGAWLKEYVNLLPTKMQAIPAFIH